MSRTNQEITMATLGFVFSSAFIGVPPRLRLSPLRCPPRGRDSRLGAALRRECVPPRLRLSPLRCPPRGRDSRLGAALRRRCGPPRLRLSPLRCPPGGSNSRLGAALRRESGVLLAVALALVAG